MGTNTKVGLAYTKVGLAYTKVGQESSSYYFSGWVDIQSIRL